MRMPQSRSQRRRMVRTPGGETVMHYEKRKPKAAKCGGCGAVLPGVARGRPVDLQRIAKTQKRPERPYGGVLCSKCMRSVFVKKARG